MGGGEPGTGQPGRDVVLIGAPALAKAYRDALALAGLEPRVADATTMTRAGLAAAREVIRTRAASNGAAP